ncbi:MAG: ATP-dependent DNA helicase RecG, partial [Propionibacteriaceae bacterium]
VRDRLAEVAATRDGFRLAEVDLAQRREGDVLGTTQAGGRFSLRLLKVIEHADVIEVAHAIAREAIERDPALSTPGFCDMIAMTESLADAAAFDAD